MSTKVAVGINKGPNSLEAGRDAAFSAKIALQSEEINLALVFASVNFDLEDVLRGIKRVIKSVPLLGTSGAGVITKAGSEKRAVAVMLISSSNIKLGLSSSGPVHAGKEKISGRQLAQQSVGQTKGFNRHAFTLLCDSLIENPVDLISGIQEVLGKSFPIAGGFSADDGHFGKTYQFFENQVLSYSATGILWTGHCDCAIATAHGWQPLGRPRTVTDCGINCIKRIEGKPALQLYENYFGENIEELKQTRLSKIALLYPLGFYVSKEDGYILRNVLGVEKDGSLNFKGNVPQNSEVRLMIGTKDSLIAAARNVAKLVKAELNKKGKKIKLAIICDSFSRFKLLGRSSDKEIEAVKDELGSDVAIIGFYSFGEQAPLSAVNFIGKSYILNETINILAVGE